MRPLNFTVRFRMRQPLALVLAFAVALRLDSAVGQTRAPIEVRVLADNTCTVDQVHIACSDVLAKLRELGAPADLTVHFGADKSAKYDVVASTFESLQRSGYMHKLGYMNVR